MSDVIGDPPEDEEDEEGEEEEEDEEDGEWETENGLIYQIVDVPAEGEDPAHDEVLLVEEDEKGNLKDVAIALSVEDVDEAIDTLKEIKEEMVKRQNARSGAINPMPKPAAKPRKK